jgi:hypothetical protein
MKSTFRLTAFEMWLFAQDMKVYFNQLKNENTLERNSFLYFAWQHWLRNYATSRKVAGLIPDDVIGFFNWTNPSSRPGFDSASNRNEYQESSWGRGGKGRPANKADNLTAICELII